MEKETYKNLLRTHFKLSFVIGHKKKEWKSGYTRYKFLMLRDKETLEQKLVWKKGKDMKILEFSPDSDVETNTYNRFESEYEITGKVSILGKRGHKKRTIKLKFFTNENEEGSMEKIDAFLTNARNTSYSDSERTSSESSVSRSSGPYTLLGGKKKKSRKQIKSFKGGKKSRKQRKSRKGKTRKMKLRKLKGGANPDVDQRNLLDRWIGAPNPASSSGNEPTTPPRTQENTSQNVPVGTPLTPNQTRERRAQLRNEPPSQVSRTLFNDRPVDLRTGGKKRKTRKHRTRKHRTRKHRTR